MAKLRIEFDRENCIGAFACVSMDPEHWIQSPSDGAKADLKGSTEKDGKRVLEIEVDDAGKEKAVQAAQSCPASVIKVFEGEKQLV